MRIYGPFQHDLLGTSSLRNIGSEKLNGMYQQWPYLTICIALQKKRNVVNWLNSTFCNSFYVTFHLIFRHLFGYASIWLSPFYWPFKTSHSVWCLWNRLKACSSWTWTVNRQQREAKRCSLKWYTGLLSHWYSIVQNNLILLTSSMVNFPVSECIFYIYSKM